MQTNRTQSFTDADLGKMMAAANAARSAELRRMFHAARNYVANAFAARGQAVAQN